MQLRSETTCGLSTAPAYRWSSVVRSPSSPVSDGHLVRSRRTACAAASSANPAAVSVAFSTSARPPRRASQPRPRHWLRSGCNSPSSARASGWPPTPSRGSLPARAPERLRAHRVAPVCRPPRDHADRRRKLARSRSSEDCGDGSARHQRSIILPTGQQAAHLRDEATAHAAASSSLRDLSLVRDRAIRTDASPPSNTNCFSPGTPRSSLSASKSN
jgi:hypothetical protein